MQMYENYLNKTKNKLKKIKYHGRNIGKLVQHRG